MTLELFVEGGGDTNKLRTDCRRGFNEFLRSAGIRAFPRSHLKQRDDWDKPATAPDSDCHLMVQEMESWLVADPETLKAYFGKDFDPTQLPSADAPIEDLSKDQIARSLAAAARKTKQQGYQKGRDSFRLLETVNGTLVVARSGWAKRFVEGVRQAKRVLDGAQTAKPWAD